MSAPSVRPSGKVPLRITQVERLTVASAIPRPREIVGWRVVEVESELTAKGFPPKKLDDYKTFRWSNGTNFPTGTCAGTGPGSWPKWAGDRKWPRPMSLRWDEVGPALRANRFKALAGRECRYCLTVWNICYFNLSARKRAGSGYA